MTIYFIFSCAAAFVTGISYSYFFTRKEIPVEKKCFFHIYQFVLNSICSFVGWMAFYLLYLRFTVFLTIKSGLDLSDLILLLLGIFGVTGHLGELVFRTPKAIDSYLKKGASAEGAR